jgi:hypothetical protein
MKKLNLDKHAKEYAQIVLLLVDKQVALLKEIKRLKKKVKQTRMTGERYKTIKCRRDTSDGLD